MLMPRETAGICRIASARMTSVRGSGGGGCAPLLGSLTGPSSSGDRGPDTPRVRAAARPSVTCPVDPKDGGGTDGVCPRLYPLECVAPCAAGKAPSERIRPGTTTTVSRRIRRVLIDTSLAITFSISGPADRFSRPSTWCERRLLPKQVLKSGQDVGLSAGRHQVYCFQPVQ